MLKAKIDASCYPIVKIEAKERPVVPSMALKPMEFHSLITSNPNFAHDHLLYFQEEE